MSALEAVLLWLADDELIIGHRHSEWTGWAPHIEEDIAFSSIAQDEIGHANLFYTLLSDVSSRTPDEWALAREAHEYRNAIICERPNGDWAYTLARHFLYDSAEKVRLEALAGSSHGPLADVSEKLLREERYHFLHADAWFRRLSTGPMEGRHQLAVAMSDALPDATGLFELTSFAEEAVSEGIITRSFEEMLQEWLTTVIGRIEDAGLPFTLTPQDDKAQFLPTSSGELLEEPDAANKQAPSLTNADGRWVLEGTFPGRGGREGKHSSDFTPLWEDLTKTYREEPSATW